MRGGWATGKKEKIANRVKCSRRLEETNIKMEGGETGL